MGKKRLLFVGEASYLATGFSTYWNEVIKRINATGRFEVAEFGSYAGDSDPRNQHVPWKFYSNAPDPNDQAANQAYHSRHTNQFGEWRLNDVLLDWKPDTLLLLRDFWMDEFVLRSPLRSNFKVIWMPTIDGAPQRKLWVDAYKQCDAIMTYSQWGKNLLEKEYDLKVTAVASPGAELDLFKPVPDKGAHKAKHGINPSSFIIGTVMRNQKRKLYVDLIEAFAEWLRSSKKSSHLDIAKKTYLYLHTSYPDVGYDIGDAIQKFKVGNKVLMTYLCSACGTAYPSFFSGEWTHCRRCGKLAAHPPNANHSVGRDVLASIYNLFDVYVQYSICLHPDTPILLSDYTHKRIADIKSGDKIINGNGDTVDVDWCKQTSNTSSTVEITTHENPKPVIVTKDHRVLTMNENGEFVFIEAKDLLNKWVVCPANNAKIFDAIKIHNPRKNSKYRKKYKDYLLIKVKSVEPSDYTGPVYDLAVVPPKGGDANSRSFVANHFVTHNCEG
jgi:hypothetical protein